MNFIKIGALKHDAIHIFGEEYVMDNLEIYATRYIDGTLAIIVGDVNMYEKVTVNLSGYDMEPRYGWVNLDADFLKQPYAEEVLAQIADPKRFGFGITYGYCSSYEVKLKDEIIAKIEKHEQECSK